MKDYGLDLHCTMMMEDYLERLPVLRKIQEIVVDKLNECVEEAGITIDGVASRIKTEKSLAGKLAKKGYKYNSIDDITDLVGARIITFYTDDVDKISSLVDKYFNVDWENSVDKRKSHELDSFGYNSLHYICTIPECMYHDPEHPEINTIRVEVQMRTALQHAWATINHDIGYKTDIEIPREHLRNLTRLAGMLELADEQFSNIRTSINDYRRQVQGLVEGGKFDEVPLNGDSFASYLELNPFDKLNKRIAAVNQAEILPAPLDHYFEAFKALGMNTLGDLDRLIKENSDDAFVLASRMLGRTDLDIISSSIGVQNLCYIKIIKAGIGLIGIKKFLEIVEGQVSDDLEERAMLILEDAKAVQIGC
ncbi:MAG: hypothetical protein KBT05_07130 [Bacteroidales bacterium]|nr:hypothetical protein [Candidatus Cryptobacteroides caccocaballi]